MSLGDFRRAWETTPNDCDVDEKFALQQFKKLEVSCHAKVKIQIGIVDDLNRDGGGRGAASIKPFLQ